MVLRRYSHGGLLRAITWNLYLFGARSFRELTLTEEVRSCGIPTISSIGAIHHRIFYPFYQAYFLSLEVPRAMDLIQYFQEIGTHLSRENLSLKRKTIRSVGLLIRQFHQAGFSMATFPFSHFSIFFTSLFPYSWHCPYSLTR
jgi:hypothetical protein